LTNEDLQLKFWLHAHAYKCSSCKLACSASSATFPKHYSEICNARKLLKCEAYYTTAKRLKSHLFSILYVMSMRAGLPCSRLNQQSQSYAKRQDTRKKNFAMHSPVTIPSET
jgi:hypothetical protein